MWRQVHLDTNVPKPLGVRIATMCCPVALLCAPVVCELQARLSAPIFMLDCPSVCSQSLPCSKFHHTGNISSCKVENVPACNHLCPCYCVHGTSTGSRCRHRHAMLAGCRPLPEETEKRTGQKLLQCDLGDPLARRWARGCMPQSTM